jgi:hypothetical protein
MKFLNALSQPFLRIYGYLKKDFLLLYKRKKYLYTFILLPLVIAGLFLFALSPSGYEIKTGVCDFDNTIESKQSFSDLHGFKAIVLEQENCMEELILGIKNRKYSIGIEIPQGFSENLNNLKQSHISIHYDNTDIAFSNLVAWRVDASLYHFKREIVNDLNYQLNQKVKSIRSNVDLLVNFVNIPEIKGKLKEIDDDLKKVEDIDTEFIVNPIWVNHKPIYQDSFGKDAGIVFIFPILALFIILMLASTSIIYDKKNNFILRVKSSTTPFLYLLAKVLFFVFLALVQFLIIYLLFLIYGASYSINLFEALKFIFYIGAINCLIGLFIGLISENEGVAVLFSLIIAFPLMLVSGIFFPLQTLPKIIQYISNLLPLSYQINAGKAVFLFNQKISITWFYSFVFLFFLVYLFIKKKE